MAKTYREIIAEALTPLLGEPVTPSAIERTYHNWGRHYGQWWPSWSVHYSKVRNAGCLHPMKEVVTHLKAGGKLAIVEDHYSGEMDIELA